jgi:hypothetical protein
MEPRKSIEISPDTLRLLARLAKGRAHDGVVPSIGSVVATLAQAEAARRAQERDAE